MAKQPKQNKKQRQQNQEAPAMSVTVNQGQAEQRGENRQP